MTIGVGVEGPSDRTFWTKVLHKHFSGVRFDVRNMQNKGNLIRETPQLLDSFRSFHYAACFILVDRHSDACTKAVFDRFDAVIQQESRRPYDERYVFICVAIKGLESWYLADPVAINKLLPKANYAAPHETANLSPKQKLKKLWKKQYGENSAPNKIRFAHLMAPQFEPAEGRHRSASFDYLWTRLTDASKASKGTK